MKTIGRLLVGLGALLLVAGLAVAALGLWGWRSVHRPFREFSGEEKILSIEPGRSARSILDTLEEEGVLADAGLARAYLVWVLDDPSLKAGEYRFTRPLTMPQVLSKLANGEVVTHAVTLVEGLNLQETARSLEAAGFATYESLLAEMSSPERISDLDPEASDLEGYLFPDTYSFARGTTAAEIVSTLVATFRRKISKQQWSTGLDGDDRTLREIVSLAAIVEKEAALADERATIAGVYANRLRIGMALGADPTVIYAIVKRGDWDGNLRRDDLRYDSPYNTYVYPGLPPGPICSPGAASIQAAAEPADVPYLYFVSRNDGSHVFARTLAEHNRNVYRWQKQYWRERWARERAAARADPD